MPPSHDEEVQINFAEFLNSQMREKGVTVKRLSEMTGIAPMHLEGLLHGNFDDMPPTPYFHGYLLRIGKTLGFDGEEWWKRIKSIELVHGSGAEDALPHNRFIKKSIPMWVWLTGVAAFLIIIYASLMLPRILGKPTLAINFPSSNIYSASTTSITFQGITHNADALYLGNGASSSMETIPIAADGSWQKTVLLQNGLNTFEFHAKKFLGGETSMTEQVLYDAPGTENGGAGPGTGAAAGAGASTGMPSSTSSSSYL